MFCTYDFVGKTNTHSAACAKAELLYKEQNTVNNLTQYLDLITIRTEILSQQGILGYLPLTR